MARLSFEDEIRKWSARMETEPETMPSGNPRQRCARCRKGFAFSCVDRRYCSPECAGWPDYRWHAVWAMNSWIDDIFSCWCRTSGGLQAKVSYTSILDCVEAARALAEPFPLYAYLCPHRTDRYHITKLSSFRGQQHTELIY